MSEAKAKFFQKGRDEIGALIVDLMPREKSGEIKLSDFFGKASLGAVNAFILYNISVSGKTTHSALKITSDEHIKYFGDAMREAVANVMFKNQAFAQEEAKRREESGILWHAAGRHFEIERIRVIAQYIVDNNRLSAAQLKGIKLFDQLLDDVEAASAIYGTEGNYMLGSIADLKQASRYPQSDAEFKLWPD